MKTKKYELRIVNMDVDFNTSVSDNVCGEFDTMKLARKEFSRICKEIKAAKKDNLKWWQENAPVYVAIEYYENESEIDGQDDWCWKRQVATKEFRLEGKSSEDEESNVVEEEAPCATEASDDYNVPESEGVVEDTHAYDVKTIPYMIYRNCGGNVRWFGHSINYFMEKNGDETQVVRMNNKGVSKGQIVCERFLTYAQIHLFHICYGIVVNMKESYEKQLDRSVSCLVNIYKFVPDDKAEELLENVDTKMKQIKITDYVLNLG